MREVVLVGLIAVVGLSFAEPMPSPMPMQSPSMLQPPQQQMPMSMPPQPQSFSSSVQLSVTPQPDSMMPIEIKPEDRAIINLKKRMIMRQTYNEYQKVDKAVSIDKVNLERSLREARYALKVQLYKERQLDSRLLHPYYYDISVVGVVGDVVLTNLTPIKDGAVLRGEDRISVKGGLVYIGDYLVSYPVMSSIKEPKVDVDTGSSTPQLLTGLPTFGSGGAGSSTGSSLTSLPSLPPPPLPSSK